MEKLKGKHNHTLTNILKVFTFAIVLLFPFLVFMPSALYYGFNEHAQIEIPQKVGIYQTNEVNNIDDIKPFNIYHLDNLEVNETNSVDFADLYIINAENLINYAINFEIDDFAFNKITNNLIYELTISENYVYVAQSMDFNDDYIAFTYQFNNSASKIQLQNFDFFIHEDYIDETKYWLENNTNLPTASNFNVYEITETTTISENLSNSWEKMWQTPLFAWTENTPFTATTNAFASVFNISQQSGIYNLLAYFITITGIYLVIDIVIGVATMLTHMIAKQD